MELAHSIEFYVVQWHSAAVAPLREHHTLSSSVIYSTI